MYKDTEAGRKCQCVSAGLITNRINEGWRWKYVYALARVDKPGREIQLLIASLLPTTPDQLEELLRPKFKMPPRKSKVIGDGGGTGDLPNRPPAFPYNCNDLLYHPGGLGLNVCRMFQPTIKVWNPNDPCLKLAAEIYYNEDDDISKLYTDQNRLAALELYQALLRVEQRRLVCRAECDPQWPTACAAACDDDANAEIAYHERHYAERSEELRLGENEARTQNKNWFWLEAAKCGYTDMSLPKGPKGWGKEPQMPRLQGQY